MKYFKKMIGKLCYLSPMNTEDAEKYVAWLNDMEVAQYLTVAYHNISLDVDLLAGEFSGSSLPPLPPGQ